MPLVDSSVDVCLSIGVLQYVNNYMPVIEEAYRVLKPKGKFDLHIHSKYSKDSFMEIEKIVRIAKKRGLKGLAITDHNSFKVASEALQIARNNDFIIILGMEIKTEVGDIIGLFLTKEVISREYITVVQEIKQQGGLVVFPHPFGKNSKFKEEFANDVDLIEMFNSRTKMIDNIKAQNVVSKYNIPCTVGSDAHNYFEIGRASIRLRGDRLHDIKRELLKKNNQLRCRYTNYYLSYSLSVINEFIKK